MQVRAPASENIAGAASTASAFAHVPIATGVPLAATSLLSSFVIVNVALKGREEQTAATTRLRPRPSPPCDPPSRFKRCQRRSQDSAGEREEGHRPNGGRRGRVVCSCARPPPPPRDATVRFRGSGGSSDDDDDKKQRQWQQRR